MRIFKTLLTFMLIFILLLSGCSKQVSKEISYPEVEKVAENTENTLSPTPADATSPDAWNIKWDIFQNGTLVDEYTRETPIHFKYPEHYSSVEGITTFRGNNYRNDAAFGTADIFSESLEIMWNNPIGSLGEWSGCGWSGQPIIVRWDENTKEIMNIYPEKKAKVGLTEVIYATLDGNIYFYDIDDGKPTRDKLTVGMTFKGTGTLDPRGYPIMYIGSGIANSKAQRMYVINLIDTTILYEQGGNDSASYRGWYAFDSSPVLHAETDTLFWPGENGILYTLKLNTVYKPEEKLISVSPENVAKIRYKIGHPSKSGRWVGFESSCVTVGNYLYVADNVGMLFCIDINTMKPVWIQDIHDDTNASPVFEWDYDGNGYIYIAPSLRWTASGGKGTTKLFKVDARTGEILWSIPYDCIRHDDTSGGVQSTPVVGRKGSDLEGLVFFNVAFSPSGYSGKLVAIDSSTGEKVWEHDMKSYTWSSPVAVYNPEGKGYIVICDSVGNVKLIDGADGDLLSTVNIGSNVESSPAIFENKIVVGTRGCRIYGVEIS